MMRIFAAVAIAVAVGLISIPVEAQEPINKPAGTSVPPPLTPLPAPSSNLLIIAPMSKPDKTDKQQQDIDTKQDNGKSEPAKSNVNPCYGNNQPSWCN